ncbi:uncharacterized protein [Manis javanica]|uniref:uncharacterized protein isoform X9 n=1 Tax=Manis javanica TaxID=9974 RepID=UPI003C6D1DE9
MVDRRCARLRLPPGAQAPAAPAIGSDLEPPPRPDLRSSSSAASSRAPSDLLRSVQSGPRFRGEGDSDGSVGRKDADQPTRVKEKQGLFTARSSSGATLSRNASWPLLSAKDADQPATGQRLPRQGDWRSAC